MRYAHDTSVSVDRSKAEIERLLQRYGASEFAHGWRAGRAVIQFRMRDRCRVWQLARYGSLYHFQYRLGRRKVFADQVFGLAILFAAARCRSCY